jgi:small subunit ribosomal protein S9
LSDDPTQEEGASPEEDAPVEEPAAPAEEVPADDAPGEVPAEADVAPAGEPEEQAAPPEEAPQEEPAAEEPAAEEPAAEEPAPEEGAEEPAAEESTEQPKVDAPAAEARKKDEAPGANLEPLLIEDERELSAEERARLEAEQEEAAARAAEESDTVAEEPALREGAKLDLPAGSRIQATGKRKTAIARVVIVKGKGQFQVNRKSIEDYFPRSLHQTIAKQALLTSGYDSQVDVKVRVHGGGVSGQADAVRHATARALIEIDPELRGELKRRGMLTRDAREKERRKAGLKKARKRPQFSKR